MSHFGHVKGLLNSPVSVPLLDFCFSQRNVICKVALEPAVKACAYNPSTLEIVVGGPCIHSQAWPLGFSPPAFPSIQKDIEIAVEFPSDL